MGNSSFGKGMHFERARTQARVDQAYKSGQRSGGWLSLVAAAVGGVLVFAGQVGRDKLKERSARKRAASSDDE